MQSIKMDIKKNKGGNLYFFFHRKWKNILKTDEFLKIMYDLSDVKDKREILQIRGTEKIFIILQCVSKKCF